MDSQRHGSGSTDSFGGIHPKIIGSVIGMKDKLMMDHFRSLT